jgi:hypothetical protein
VLFFYNLNSFAKRNYLSLATTERWHPDCMEVRAERASSRDR